MDNSDYPFHYGSMSKTELAWLYFPDRKPEAARRKLNMWVRHNKALSGELEKTGYTSFSKLLTPAQVGLIIRYLGEP